MHLCETCEFGLVRKIKCAKAEYNLLESFCILLTGSEGWNKAQVFPDTTGELPESVEGCTMYRQRIIEEEDDGRAED